MNSTQTERQLPSVSDIYAGFRESRKAFDDAQNETPYCIPSDFTTAEDARSQMENARKKFVQDQFEELYNKIQRGIEECCEEYREKGVSEGLQLRIDTNTLAPENREALEKAGYHLEPEFEEAYYSWIRVNITDSKK